MSLFLLLTDMTGRNKLNFKDNYNCERDRIDVTVMNLGNDRVRGVTMKGFVTKRKL